MRNFVALVREAAPGLRTFATADPVEGLTGFIDHWCLRNLDHAGAAKERAEKHGEVVTFCDNYRTFIDYPAVSARSLGWLAWKIGARGWLTYETLGSYRTAWEAPRLFMRSSMAQPSGAWARCSIPIRSPERRCPACAGSSCARAVMITSTSGSCAKH